MPAKICLIGKTFGRWKVLQNAPSRIWKGKTSLRFSLCQCECGVIREVKNGTLTTGNSKSCGCLKRDTDRNRMLHDYTGERIGRLIVLEQTEPMPRRWTTDRHPLGNLMRRWKVRCDCGVERIMQTQTLRKQRVSGYGSCGCWNLERNRAERKKHTKPYAFYLNRMQTAAKQRGIGCSLTYDELLSLIPIDGKCCCHYCGASLIWLKYDLSKENPNRKSGYNFDRRDNRIGYSVSNLVPCCGDCNRTRGDRFSYEEFLEISCVIRKIREQRIKNAFPILP